jgi:hypothetical protein
MIDKVYEVFHAAQSVIVGSTLLDLVDDPG